ncbi:MAG: ABC transporter ATP-binding protein [Deltaproteobacteria bacterium]|nr:ABC transporter ATP-binding protein [Deltaproteobacteria bacterium]
MINILEIENLSYRFSNNVIGIDKINLVIRKGEFVVIAGPNGSGKTTLLRHLNGLLLPDTGKVKLNGALVSDNLALARQKVGMIFQDADSQIVGETVYDDAAFGPENLGLSKEEVKKRVMAALKAVDLTDHLDQRPHTLSAGEKRRLAIAGILAMEPEVVVFDEPFSNLDYPGVKQVLRQIISMHRAGRTILVSTHDIEKIIAHADRLIIMKDGRVVRDRAPASLMKELETFGIREPCISRMGLEVVSWLN